MTALVDVPGGSFTLGSDRHYPEERPAHEVRVEAFRIAVGPVTVAQFAVFVADTGWRTAAEREPTDFAVPAGSAVFTPPDHPVDLADATQWWSWVPGAQWRHPTGPASRAEPDHPVVQVAYADALAYCAWSGTALPSEAQWERAAQGSRHEDANTWTGAFPWDAQGPATTSAVGSFGSNPLGLLDMIGNTWEWTADPWTHDHAPRCCAPAVDPLAPGAALHVAKGGSYLCSADYCARYRPQARMAMAVDSPSCHLGFRVVQPLV